MANILICDDDVDIVSALKIYLSNEDYKIYTALDRKSTRLNSSHSRASRMPSSA